MHKNCQKDYEGVKPDLYQLKINVMSEYHENNLDIKHLYDISTKSRTTSAVKNNSTIPARRSDQIYDNSPISRMQTRLFRNEKKIVKTQSETRETFVRDHSI